MKKIYIILSVIYLFPLINYSQTSLFLANGVKYSNSSSSDDFNSLSLYEEIHLLFEVYDDKVIIDGQIYKFSNIEESGIFSKTFRAQLENPYIKPSTNKLAVTITSSSIYSRVEEIIIEYPGSKKSKKIDWIKIKTYNNNGLGRDYFWMKLVNVPSYYLKSK